MQAVLLDELLAGAGALGLVGDDPVGVVGVEDAIPQPALLEPLAARVAEDVLYRGADVEAAPFDARLEDVGNRP